MKLKASLSIMIILSVFLAVGVLSVASQDSTADQDVGEPLSTTSTQTSLGTAITYQGFLKDNGNDANGKYDFQFLLFDAVSGGNQVGNTVTINDVTVTDGIFTTSLDFGASAFNTSARYLEIRVRSANSSNPHEKLDNRQAITASPHALGVVSQHLEIKGPELNSGIVAEFVNSDGRGTRIFADRYSTGLNVRKQSDQHGMLYYDFSTNTWKFENNGAKPVSINNGGIVVTGNINSDNVNVGDTVTAGTLIAKGSSLNSGTVAAFYNSSPYGLRIFANRYNTGLHARKQGDQQGSFYYDFQTNAWITENNNSGQPTFIISGNGTVRAKSFAQLMDVSNPTQSDMSLNNANNANVQIEPQPGMVVCIDPNNPGMLIVCENAYDTTIVGALSGAGENQPDTMAEQNVLKATGAHSVAMMGSVYVQVDASYGAVEPGDFLTTSDTPGHAMKATDSEQARGAIIGKAMTGLNSDTGLVLVLIALQ